MNICPQCDEQFADDVKVCPHDGTILSSGFRRSRSLIGAIFDGKYKLIKEIGKGGMGTVFKAEHTMMSRPVAIKVLHTHLVEEIDADEFLRRFQREARTACKVEHPNAVTIYDFGVYEDYVYLVMQFIKGKTLAQILTKEKQLSTKRVYKLMAQICGAVGAAHKLDIVHRDLKADNIICTRDESGAELVQVLDFGLAKVLGETGQKVNSMTKTGFAMGTPQCMSPEQVIGNALDARSDVYSLGILMYQMLAGRVPFESENVTELLMMHVNDEPIPLKVIEPEIPKGVADAVMKALKKHPDQRQANAVKLLEELRVGMEDEKAVAKAEKAAKAKQVSNSKKKSNSGKRSFLPNALGFSAAAILGLAIGFVGYPHYMQFTATGRAEIERKEKTKSYVEKGAEFVAERKYSSAVTQLKLALELDGENALAHYHLGTAYAAQYNLDQAISSLAAVTKLDPRFAKAHLSLANAYFKRGNFRDAEKSYKRALRLNPKSKLARENLELCRKALKGDGS